MRTLAITENITVDGSIEMLTDWFDPQAQAGADMSDVLDEQHRQSRQADALLVGRRTFEAFRGYWPKQADDATGITAYLNQEQKYVVSGSLTNPGWENTTVLASDPAAWTPVRPLMEAEDEATFVALKRRFLDGEPKRPVGQERADAAKLYAAGTDLKDPQLSPVYGDYAGFPPTILTSGTRDLFLSNTVRVHRKLRQAGVVSDLHVFEGQSHAQYYADPYGPETKEHFAELTAFFDKYLGK